MPPKKSGKGKATARTARQETAETPRQPARRQETAETPRQPARRQETAEKPIDNPPAVRIRLKGQVRMTGLI